MTIGVPIVTCLPELYQQCNNSVPIVKKTVKNSQTAKNDHWCTNRYMSTQSPPNTQSPRLRPPNTQSHQKATDCLFQQHETLRTRYSYFYVKR